MQITSSSLFGPKLVQENPSRFHIGFSRRAENKIERRWCRGGRPEDVGCRLKRESRLLPEQCDSTAGMRVLCPKSSWADGHVSASVIGDFCALWIFGGCCYLVRFGLIFEGRLKGFGKFLDWKWWVRADNWGFPI